MIALNPIKKDELSHTEPKLWLRRRQIEIPTGFNNVDEIPGAIEKISVPLKTWRPVLAELNGGGHSCYAQLGTDLPAPSYSVAHISNLLSHDHLWHRHGTSSVTICVVEHQEGNCPFMGRVGEWGGAQNTHTHTHTHTHTLAVPICPKLCQIIRCLLR
jgi:hypothetical protein